MSYTNKKRKQAFFGDLDAFKILTGLITLGMVGNLIFCFHFPDSFFLSLSNILLITGVSLIIGALVGFLFGIPKSLQIQDRSIASEDSSKGTETHSKLYAANTNLEQISDWLTKILVGVGLTQLSNIPDLIKSTSEFISFGFGKTQIGTGFISLLLVYYTICGFLFSYLWTRLYLVGAFQKAEIVDSKVLHGIIAYAETFDYEFDENQKNVVNFLRKEAEEILDKAKSAKIETIKILDKLARKYEQIRETMPSSKKRTFEMNEIVSQIRSAVKLSEPKKTIFLVVLILV